MLTLLVLDEESQRDWSITHKKSYNIKMNVSKIYYEFESIVTTFNSKIYMFSDTEFVPIYDTKLEDQYVQFLSVIFAFNITYRLVL